MYGGEEEEEEEEIDDPGKKSRLRDLTRSLFDVFQGETEEDEAPDFGLGPDARPEDEPYGTEERRLLGEYVRKGDPRALRDEWDPADTYLLGVGPDENEDDGGRREGRLRRLWGRGPDRDRLAQNLDGLLDTDDINDPQMRHALNYKAPRYRQTHFEQEEEEEEYEPEMEPEPEPEPETETIKGGFLHPQDARALTYRFRRAQMRALESERLVADRRGAGTQLMPSLETIKRVAGDPVRHLAYTFDTNTRLADLRRAMSFFASNPQAFDALVKAAGDRAADAAGRRQYSDYACDVLNRVRAHIKSGRRRPSQTYAVATASARRAAIATRMRVGHPMAFADTIARPKRIHPLDVPVFSRAAWTIRSRHDDNNHEEEPESSQEKLYYTHGNEMFLSARLGMDGAERERARRDAMAFFRTRFGLDFDHGKPLSSDQPETLVHPTMPVVMEPYTVSPSLASDVVLAEGHLGSADDPHRDPEGNGLRQYGTDGISAVIEGGWLVRPTSKEGAEVTMGGGKKVPLPRGSIISTGFWVLDRPGAPPALLRFQSAAPAGVKLEVLARDRPRTDPRRGVRHQITARWDVYDMAHDAAMRPVKGVGRGISVIRIESRRDGTKRHQARTLVTIHH